MGRIWFVPKENLAKKKWCFQNLMIYINRSYLVSLKRGYRCLTK
jgi:hypothetical protein